MAVGGSLLSTTTLIVAANCTITPSTTSSIETISRAGIIFRQPEMELGGGWLFSLLSWFSSFEEGARVVIVVVVVVALSSRARILGEGWHI